MLVKSIALQNAILHSANFSIIATDPHGIIQLFNVGAERMLGYQAAQVVDQIKPSDLHDSEEVLARARALSDEFGLPIAPGFEALSFKASRGIEDIYEISYIRADGTRFPAIVSITALRDEYEEIIGYLLIGSHNSVRKRVERELNDAMTAAGQANLAKSEFLSNMSHELRTPLNAILGFAQLIESGSPPPTPAQGRGVAQILKAGWYLLDLINEILDLALIESGKLSLSLEPIQLADVVLESQAMIEAMAAERGIEVAFAPLGPALLVSADRTRLKQVLINLLSNAIKYNRDQGKVVVAFQTQPHGRLKILITDTGNGLRADQISQLFQPFNRLGQQDQSIEGTGIGLVVCKRLVELMGGRIGVESTVGEGSTFWIELNQAVMAAHVAIATHVAAAPLPRVGVNIPLHTLLYVEDNPDNLLLVEELMVRRPDICLISAKDAGSGIALARASRPDVILMDINLPRMSGVEALRTLAQDPATARIPVIALSANAEPRAIAKGLQAGFFRYLTKPIKVAEFMRTLDLALESMHAQPPKTALVQGAS